MAEAKKPERKLVGYMDCAAYAGRRTEESADCKQVAEVWENDPAAPNALAMKCPAGHTARLGHSYRKVIRPTRAGAAATGLARE